MDKVWKPKAYLVSVGALPAGSENARGRLSGENKKILADAAVSGTLIEGYTTPPASSTPTATPAPAPKVETSGVLDVRDPIRDQRYWTCKVSSIKGLNPGSMTQVCNNCGNSLTYCFCKTAVVNVDHETQGVVIFMPKK